MKREVLQRQLAWGLLCLLTCCGCSRFKKEVAAPNGFGLLHRNVESTTLPPVQQVNHDQLIKPVALEEKKKETAGQFLERQFDWMIGRGKSRPASIRLLADAEQIYNRAPHARATGNGVTSDDEIERLYLEAAKVYDRSAKRWSDSALHEDALFMAAESYFFGHRYPEADERYERLLKDYPKSRYLDQIQRRRFSIAHYWLKMDQLDHQQFYEFNLMDPTVPWRDQFNYGVRILDQIRLDDPTGDIADDATLLAADACLELGRYQQADNLYSDLIKAFPSSEHQFRAHRAAIQTKLRRYRGPDYGDAALLESEKLLKQLKRQFPQQARQQQQDLARINAEIHYKKAEREWSIGQFFDERASYGAAKMYYSTLLKDYADTPFAAPARRRLSEIAGRPAQPAQRFQWLANLFDRKDDVSQLLEDSPLTADPE